MKLCLAILWLTGSAYSSKCLNVSTHNHGRISLATLVKSQIQDDNDPAPSTAKTNWRKLANCPEYEEDMLKSLSRRVSSKLEEAVFQPVVMETSGVIDSNSTVFFLRALGVFWLKILARQILLPAFQRLNSGAARECSSHPGLCQQLTLTHQFILFYCFTYLVFSHL